MQKNLKGLDFFQALLVVYVGIQHAQEKLSDAEQETLIWLLQHPRKLAVAENSVERFHATVRLGFRYVLRSKLSGIRNHFPQYEIKMFAREFLRMLRKGKITQRKSQPIPGRVCSCQHQV